MAAVLQLPKWLQVSGRQEAFSRIEHENSALANLLTAMRLDVVRVPTRKINQILKPNFEFAHFFAAEKV